MNLIKWGILAGKVVPATSFKKCQTTLWLDEEEKSTQTYMAMEFMSNTELNSENSSNTPTQNWKEVTEAIIYLKEESKSHKYSMRKLAGQMEKLLNNQIVCQQQQQQEHGWVDREELP